MNIRLVGAALLLLSTLSLSPIAEAQTGGVSTTFRVSGQVTNPVIFNLAKLQKFAVSTQNVTFFAAGKSPPVATRELCYGMCCNRRELKSI
jgi:TolB-like protein